MSFDIFKQQGNDCFRKGQWEQAISWYQKCIDLEPKNAVGYSNLAMALIKSSDFQEAYQACQTGLVYVQDAKLRSKLEYRLKIAKAGTVSTSEIIPVPIIEVDDIPREFQSL